MPSKLTIKALLELLLIVAVAFSSSAMAQNGSIYQDKNALFGYKDNFLYLGISMGFLENTKFLKEKEKESLRILQGRITTIKQKYKSQAINDMWQNFYEAKYQEGANRAKTLDLTIETSLNDRKTVDGSPVLPNPYTCTSYNENRKTGEKHSYQSDYVSNVNENIKSARRTLHSLEYYLPKAKNSGMMMLTQADHDKIDGDSVFCIPRDGSVNPDIAKEAEAREQAKNVKKRIPPYSQSRTQQHESICSTLQQGIPAPFGAKCVYNYK